MTTVFTSLSCSVPIGPVVCEKYIKMLTVYRHQRMQSDDCISQDTLFLKDFTYAIHFFLNHQKQMKNKYLMYKKTESTLFAPCDILFGNG